MKKLVHRSGAKRAAKSARASRAASRASLDLVLDMEEPLNQATWFVRVLEQTGDGDQETDAVAFVATEARLRLEAVHDLWNKLLDSAKAL